MTDHTPEPWPDWEDLPGSGSHYALDRYNYERAAACVNACAGIPTKQLEEIAKLADAPWEAKPSPDVEALITAATTTARGLLATSHVEAKAGNDVMAADCEDYAMRLSAALAPFRKD